MIARFRTGAGGMAILSALFVGVAALPRLTRQAIARTGRGPAELRDSFRGRLGSNGRLATSAHVVASRSISTHRRLGHSDRGVADAF